MRNDSQNFLLTHVFVQNALKAAHEEGIEDKAPYKFQFEQFLFNAYLNEQRNKTFISPAEQQQYYDAHKEKYKEPFEKVKDQVYTDMLDEAQRRKISELKAKATAKVL